MGVETPGIGGGGGGGGGGPSEPASGFATGANTPALVSRNSYGAIASSPTTTTPIGSGVGEASASAPGGGGGAGVVEAAAAAGRTTRKQTTTTRAGGGAGGCKIVVWRRGDGFAARGNSVAGFVEINRAVRSRPAPPRPPSVTLLLSPFFLLGSQGLTHKKNSRE